MWEEALQGNSQALLCSLASDLQEKESELAAGCAKEVDDAAASFQQRLAEHILSSNRYY